MDQSKVIEEIVDVIEALADERLAIDSSCSGGIKAKLHNVCMDIDMEIIKLMLKRGK